MLNDPDTPDPTQADPPAADPIAVDSIRNDPMTALVRRNEFLNRLLAVLLKRHGGRIEVTEQEMQMISPEVWVFQEPIRRGERSRVYRLYEPAGCPHCD